MKTIYSSQDIEDLAARGVTRLVVDDNTVLTDLARARAVELGIRLVRDATDGADDGTRSHRQSGGRSATADGASLPAKPRGCQHAPLGRRLPGGAPVSDGSSSAVDELVDLIKQRSRRSGG